LQRPAFSVVLLLVGCRIKGNLLVVVARKGKEWQRRRAGDLLRRQRRNAYQGRFDPLMFDAPRRCSGESLGRKESGGNIYRKEEQLILGHIRYSGLVVIPAHH